MRKFASPNRQRALAAAALAILVSGGSCLLGGCGRHHAPSRVEEGNRDGVLHLGNYAEPRVLDPALAEGIPESNVLYGLYEGLVRADGADLHPTPGVAMSWDISPDQMTYTFHLRPDARWSNGTPLTARDFVGSWRRALSPKLAGLLSYYLFPLKNAEAYNKGTLKDFEQVGVHAVDDHTLRVDLAHPTPYLLRLMLQRYYFPVYLPGVEKGGGLEDRGNQNWTRAEHFVGNGPYVLTEWTPNQRIVGRKNPNYWNRDHLRINEVRYYPMEDANVEEGAFRAGLIHKTSSGNIPVAKMDGYRREKSSLLHIDPYLGSYYYMLNTTRPALADVRVRRALAMSIDRESLVKNVARGGQLPAFNYTPPGTSDYLCRTVIPYDPAGARKLLADAGHPGGAGLPPLEILINTSELHRPLAEAVQAMWKKELGLDVRLNNQEWKVYLNSRAMMDYTVCRAGWIGSLDPSFFLENFLSGGANNLTGFASPEYDRLVHQAQVTLDPKARNECFQQAEAILMESAPIVPIYFYTNIYLLKPGVQGWHSNPVDYHPLEELSLQP